MVGCLWVCADATGAFLFTWCCVCKFLVVSEETNRSEEDCDNTVGMDEIKCSLTFYFEA